MNTRDNDKHIGKIEVFYSYSQQQNYISSQESSVLRNNLLKYGASNEFNGFYFEKRYMEDVLKILSEFAKDNNVLLNVTAHEIIEDSRYSRGISHFEYFTEGGSSIYLGPQEQFDKYIEEIVSNKKRVFHSV